jgi:type VI secretion system secreted protein Hcp
MPVYMRITKNGVPVIKGDVTAKGYEQWIELNSFQFAAVRPQSFSEERNQTPPKRMSEIVVTKGRDSASNLLAHEAISNSLGSLKVEIYLVKPGTNIVNLKVTLEEVFISALSLSGDAGGSGPFESIVLDYANISYDHKTDSEDLPPPANSTAPHAGWNTRHN